MISLSDRSFIALVMVAQGCLAFQEVVVDLGADKQIEGLLLGISLAVRLHGSLKTLIVSLVLGIFKYEEGL